VAGRLVLAGCLFELELLLLGCGLRVHRVRADLKAPLDMEQES
jgi:hypothetical protein